MLFNKFIFTIYIIYNTLKDQFRGSRQFLNQNLFGFDILKLNYGLISDRNILFLKEKPSSSSVFTFLG